MKLFWVDADNRFQLAIVTRPRGNDWLDDEIGYLKAAKVDVLVSMLTSSESNELGLDDEANSCLTRGLTYLSFPIADREVPPSTMIFTEFVNELCSKARDGCSIAVHCRASIGRSSLLLAAVMCSEGFSPDDAFERISRARGLIVPDTAEQVQWVKAFATRKESVP